MPTPTHKNSLQIAPFIFTLILLAAVQLLTQAHVMDDAIANWLSLLGLVLLIIALWYQFRDPSGGQSSSAPRLK